MNQLRTFFLVLLSFCSVPLFANGLLFLSPDSSSYLPVIRSEIEVTVKQQLAVVTSTQYFRNTSAADSGFIYAYPTPENASVIDLRWTIGSVLYVADLQGSPQDSSLIGSGGMLDLNTYLGPNAVWLPLHQVVAQDSLIKVSVSYVELLPYSLNVVSLHCPNHYQPILTAPIDSQFFHVKIESQRTITGVNFVSHAGGLVTADSLSAVVTYQMANQPADLDYLLTISFAPDDLGLYSYSTLFPPGTNGCDSFGNGFFALIIEPESGDSIEVIGKDFVLILDQSGSMGGTKIQQARDAAKFIIDNLNPIDRFNIIRFSSSATAYSPQLVPYSIQNQIDAKLYIDGISSGGGTNFDAALHTALPFFGQSDSSRAQIVLFMTDGVGSPSGQGLLNLVASLRQQYAPNLNFFSVGIGSNVNAVDLTQVAQQNNGFPIFLDGGNLAQALSDFYLTIQNPVLLNPQIEFFPNVVEEVFPTSLPNLYAGQQLILLGRYVASDSVTVVLDGNLNGVPVSQSQQIFLTDSLIFENLFLYQLWAKQKIDQLMSQYLLAGATPQADSLKAEIIAISTCYGVLSPFTSFGGSGGGSGGGTGAGGGSGGGGTWTSIDFAESPQQAELRVSPNPSTGTVLIEWPDDKGPARDVTLQIMDLTGRTVFQSTWEANTSFLWNGKMPDGLSVVPGTYFVRAVWGDQVYEAILIRH